MVGRLALLIAAALIVACSGGSDEPAASATSRPAATAAATRQASGPSVSVEPRSGPPGSQITVTGQGWPANVSVDLTGQVASGSTATPYATVTTDSSGSFVARFRLEKTPDGKDLQTGRFDLIARSTSVVVDIPFLVETRRPVGNQQGPSG